MKTLRISSASEPAGRTIPTPTPSEDKPQPPPGGQLLALTPLWEQVTRTGQFPVDVDPAMVFAELGSRLRDPEWEVRQHGLRVLTDIAPVLGARRLDRCLPAVLSELTANLGHPSAAVRKGASDTLRKCVRACSNPDSVLRTVISRTNSDDRNISMGVVIHIPMLLDDRISQQTLAIIIAAVAKKLIQVSFQEHALKSLARIRDMVGEKEFNNFLEKYHPQCKQDFEILCQVYEIGEYFSDSGVDLQYPAPPLGWCEDIPDIYDPASRGRREYDESSEAEAERVKSRKIRTSARPSTSRQGNQEDSVRPSTSRPQSSRPQTALSRPQSGRVVLETEIKFNEQTAITMTILEEEEEKRNASDANTPVQDEEGDDGIYIRGSNSVPTTPRRARRVTFGGEEVLKTPPQSANTQETRTETTFQNIEIIAHKEEKTEVAKKPSLIPVRIPTEGGPNIRPVKPLPKINNSKIKPLQPKIIMEKRDHVNSPDLIKEILTSNKPDILITEPAELPEKVERVKTPEVTPSPPPFRSNSPPVPALSAAMARASSPIPLSETNIPNLDGGESLTGSSSEPEETPNGGVEEDARVASALASLGDLQEKSTVAAASWEDLAIVDASVMEDLRDRVAFTLLVAAALAEPQYFYSGVVPHHSSFYGGVYPYSSGMISPVVGSPVVAKTMPYVTPYAAVAYPAQDTSRGLPQPVQDTPEEDWRARVRGAQQLKAALRSSAAVERLRAHLPEFLAFLESLLEDASPRVVAAALATYARLAEALGQRLKPHARHVAGALCRPAASPRAEVKVEAAHAAKALMAAVGPQAACAALAETSKARSHRHREAALQLVTLGLLAFPSSQFDAPDLAGRVMPALADSKRRVRQAALEATAVLAQFIAPSALPVHLATERLRSRQSQEALYAAVNARLARRSLPAISPEGLILYSVQLPAHAARGLPGTPSGADVEWVLAGSGSTSPGSARSRAQLHTATRRASSEDSLPEEPPPSLPANPSPRTARERSHSRRRQSTHESQPSVSVTAPTPVNNHLPSPISAQDGETWTLLPVGSMQEEALGPVWTAEISAGDATSQDGIQRPMFLKLLRRQPEHVAALDKERGYILLPSKQLTASLSPGSNNSQSPHSARRVQLQPLSTDPLGLSTLDGREGRVSPLPFRPTLARVSSSERRKLKSREGSASTGSSLDSEGSPPQRSSSLRRSSRRERRDRNLSDPMLSPRQNVGSVTVSPPGSPSHGTNPIPQKPVLARNNNNNNSSGLRRASLSSPVLDKQLPGDNVSLEEVVPINVALDMLRGQTSSPSRMFPAVDTTPPALGSWTRQPGYLFPIQTMMTPEPPRNIQPKGPYFEHLNDPSPLPIRNSSPLLQASSLSSTLEAAGLSPHVVMAPPSASASSEAISGAQSTMSMYEDGDLVSGLVTKPLPPRARPARNTSNLSRERHHRSSGSVGRGSSGSGGSSSTGSSSTSLQLPVADAQDGPLRRPQEALGQCQLQMGSQDWEAVMSGLSTLKRLIKNHPDVIGNNLHGVVVDLTRHIRNLRSQVSRSACDVAGDLAVAMKRSLENELEELVSPLLNRSADTNRFLRNDCGSALDRIMENTPPSKFIPAIISQGANHRNAIVRATSARILSQSVMRLGADRVLGSTSPSNPNSAGVGIQREVRAKLLRSLAALLTEGSLDARTWSKKAFEILVRHEAFESVMEQAVPQNVMRTIQKSLSAIRRSQGPMH